MIGLAPAALRAQQAPMHTAVLASLCAGLLAACFAAPRPVQIAGWTSDAMEPFPSRDGNLLFFNSSNAKPESTDIYWARRVDALHFTLLGPAPGANSPALDGVPPRPRWHVRADLAARL